MELTQKEATQKTELSPNHVRLLKNAHKHLIATIREYRPTADLTMVEDAHSFAVEAHKDQWRKSGEPYVIHPIEVAIILAEIRADLESITAALLHDVVEDTAFLTSQIEEKFGPDVALLVEGVTKIEKHAYKTKNEAQAENFRKMLFHMSQDVRVLLIKIADRLHNMRTIGAMKKEKRVSIARETLEIYAPMAHRLGVAKLRYELEDLSFKHSNPDLYKSLTEQVKLKVADREDIVDSLIAEIRQGLEKMNLPATVEGRTKRLYSVHKKMISKNKTLDQIHDLYAVRILVEDVPQCYIAMGVVHSMYTTQPDRVKDYISGSKPNGYQSIHTTLIGPGEPFEVQIRSYQMHEVAEFGVAAHWKYKEGGKAAKDQWLQDIMAWQNEIEDNDEFLSALKMDLSAFQTHISCFTPLGEPINLVKGSCPIDFAYKIHSGVGDRMVGARVNGRIVSIDYKLQNGDYVDIVTSNNGRGPNKDWLKLVATSQARTKINQWLNKNSRTDHTATGREAMERAARELHISLDALLKDGREKDALERFHCKTLDQIYAMIGTGGLTEKQVVNHLYREYEKTLPPPSEEEVIKDLLEAGEKMGIKPNHSGIVINGLDDPDVIFSRCCSPVPGDAIVTFTTRGRGLTVHRDDCINILHMDSEERKRIQVASWNNMAINGKTFLVNLQATCPDNNNVIYAVNKLLKDENINTKHLSASSAQSHAIVHLSIYVQSTEHLEQLTTKLHNAIKTFEIRRIHT